MGQINAKASAIRGLGHFPWPTFPIPSFSPGCGRNCASTTNKFSPESPASVRGKAACEFSKTVPPRTSRQIIISCRTRTYIQSRSGKLGRRAICEHRPLDEFSELSPLERARKYRQEAEDARRQAPGSGPTVHESYRILAEHWEGLADEAAKQVAWPQFHGR